MNTDDMTRGYLECALWTATDGDERPLDDRYTVADFTPGSVVLARATCEQFARDNTDALAAYCAEYTPRGDYTVASCAGHDLWLTRNRHGAGYWGRGVTTGDALTSAAHTLGEANVWDTGDAVELDR